MTDFLSSRYLTHFGGVAALLTWVDTWRTLAQDVSIDGPQLMLGAMASRRFGLGAPRSSRVSAKPCLLVQKDEAGWVETICWDGVVVDAPGRCLWLRAAPMLGDQDKWADIPAFAVSIMVDFEEKLAPLLRFNGIELRGLWRDEGVWTIDSGPPRARWRLEARTPGQSIFKKGETMQGRSFDDLVASRLASGNRKINPGFRGTLAISESIRTQMKEELEGLEVEE
jgi:hypothetical protein